jgi:hypothetical protein
MNLLGTLTKFFVWWYGEGLIKLFQYQGAFFKYLLNMFSVKESIQHLFSPWKRLVGARRPGLEGIRDWMIDNMVSRGIGFLLRVSLILIFLTSAVVWLVAVIFVTILWLGWPIIIPYSLIAGLQNVS